MPTNLNIFARKSVMHFIYSFHFFNNQDRQFIFFDWLTQLLSFLSQFMPIHLCNYDLILIDWIWPRDKGTCWTFRFTKSFIELWQSYANPYTHKKNIQLSNFFTAIFDDTFSSTLRSTSVINKRQLPSIDAFPKWPNNY